MKTGFPNLIWFILTMFVLLPGRAVQAQAIVEEVSKGLEAERAEIQAGDIISSWACGDSKGQIESPFDFFQIEVEQKPRGRVIVQGLRGTEKQSWTLGPDAWGVQTRPELPESVLSVYRKCQALRKGGATSLPTEQCQPDAATEGPAWIRSWFALQAAEALAGARQWQLSDKAYDQSVQLGRQAGAVIAAQILNKWATASEGRGDLENAEHHYQESLLEYQKLNSESLAIAANLNGLGSVARKRGNLAKAEEQSRSALAMEEKLAPGSLDVAVSLNNLGNIAWARRDLSAAEQYHRNALQIRQKLAPGSLAVAGSFNNLGLIAWQLDDLDKAEVYQLQALEIRQKLAPNSMDIAASFNNLGTIVWERGDLAKAENYYREALAIRERLAPDSPDLADNLNNLGLVAERRGELAQSEDYFRRALLIEQKRGAESLEVTNILHNIANVLWERGDHAGADECDRRALQMREKVATGSLEVAASLNNLGYSAGERGDFSEAERYDRRALEIENKVSPDTLLAAVTFHQLGSVALAHDDITGAENFFQRALRIREKLAPGSTSHAETLLELARLMRRERKWNDSLRLFDQALQALESQTARLGGAEEVRSDFRANHAAYYADYIDLLLTQKQSTPAFQVAERSRAQSLLEMLSAGRIEIGKGVDAGLLSQERHLQRSIHAESGDRIDLLNGKHTQAQLDAVDREIEKLLVQYQQIEGQIRASNPGYMDLTRPQPLNAQQVQEQLLDPDTVLLEYSLGDDHSYVWVVSQKSVVAYQLPGRARIEGLARQAYKLLTLPNSYSQPELALRRTRWDLTAAKLSQMVLGPVAAQLQEKRWLIVADGALQYVPFAALPLPGRHQSYVPLVVKHEIVYLPSASALIALRRSKETKKVGSKTIAVLADPIFDKSDVRVKTGPDAQKPPGQSPPVSLENLSTSQHLARSEADLGLVQFPRLSFSRREADAILAVTPSGQGSEFLDFQASRTTAIAPDLAEYRIVHFATHGILNSKHPELSGLVLSLVDQRGEAQNGFLDLQDIYNLNLPADLVVLSACETALGKEIRGEGLIGLTRGFMYAGANRVLASLWNVDDVATAELMRSFYKFMEEQGMRPAEALRQAQLDMRKQKRWNKPYYWAGFQLQGEWK